MATSFEDIHEPKEITFDIRVRMGQRIAHPGLGSEMDDTLWRGGVEEISHAHAINKVKLMELEVRVRL